MCVFTRHEILISLIYYSLKNLTRRKYSFDNSISVLFTVLLQYIVYQYIIYHPLCLQMIHRITTCYCYHRCLNTQWVALLGILMHLVSTEELWYITIMDSVLCLCIFTSLERFLLMGICPLIVKKQRYFILTDIKLKKKMMILLKIHSCILLKHMLYITCWLCKGETTAALTLWWHWLGTPNIQLPQDRPLSLVLSHYQQMPQ